MLGFLGASTNDDCPVVKGLPEGTPNVRDSRFLMHLDCIFRILPVNVDVRAVEDFANCDRVLHSLKIPRESLSCTECW